MSEEDHEIKINKGPSEDDNEELIVTDAESNEPEEDVSDEQEGQRTPGEMSRELNDKYVRLYAQFDNFRKKVIKEKEEILKYGSEPLVYELLTVLDTLEMGLQHADDDPDNSVLKGVQMTMKEFLRVLEKFGVKRVTALMQPFDPEYHEAMTQVIDNEVDEGTVVQEFRKGYMYHDKLLRPALVAVSKKGSEDDEIIELEEEDEGEEPSEE